jgi:hypothetical protein
VLLGCCYIWMECSQWENWNHLFCRSFVLNRPSLSMLRCRSRYAADLSESVVSFTLSSMG